MNSKQAKELLDNLTQKRSELEKTIAVEESKLASARESLKESEARVLEIVGSLEPEKVQAHINNLEQELATEQEKLKSMEKEDNV